MGEGNSQLRVTTTVIHRRRPLLKGFTPISFIIIIIIIIVTLMEVLRPKKICLVIIF